MIAPDANLLIYASDPVSPFHRASRRWLEAILSNSEPVGFPIFSLYGFLRFVTNPNLARRPLSFKDASAVVNSWLDVSNASALYPGDRHWILLQELSAQVRLAGNMVSDAAIAAVAQEYGATVHTNDRDFARFPSLRWHNPLA